MYCNDKRKKVFESEVGTKEKEAEVEDCYIFPDNQELQQSRSVCLFTTFSEFFIKADKLNDECITYFEELLLAGTRSWFKEFEDRRRQKLEKWNRTAGLRRFTLPARFGRGCQQIRPDMAEARLFVPGRRAGIRKGPGTLRW